MKIPRFPLLLFVLASLAAYSLNATSQAWPARSITLVVPAAPGGGSDLVGRLFAEHLSSVTAKPVVVDNMPGAANTIGHRSVAKAPPDGTRLLISDSGQALFRALYPSLPFDPLIDLEQVSLFIEVPFAITVSSKLNVHTVAELVALAKSSPGKLNFGSGGLGTPNHIAGEIFKKLTGIDMAHVPYKGGGPMLSALLAHQVDVIFASTTTGGLAAHHKAGAVRVLAASGKQRSPSIPDIQSAAEVGLPDFGYTAWFGLAVPKGTSPTLVARLNDAVQTFLARQDMQQKLNEYGATILRTTPIAAQSRLEQDTREVSALISQLGIKP